MLRIIFASLCLILLGSCSNTAPKLSLYDTLEKEQCEAAEFKGTGIADTEMGAIGAARAIVAMQIQTTLEANSKLEKEVIDKKASSHFKKDIIQTSILKNASDAKIIFKKKQGNEFGIVACMSRADAAKGFLEQQRLVLDSMVLASNTALNTEHPKHKNDAWQKTQIYYNSIVAIQNLLNGWGVAKADYFDKANEIYSKTREDYKNYCVDVKLHWNPEQKNTYSEIAFSKLSSGIKMENTSCTGRGISLVYKEVKPECESHGGLYGCSYQPFLAITSCNGAELRLLESSAPIKGFGQKEEIAVEKLQDKLKKESFWKEWEQEIKQWSPQCEQ